MVLPKSSHSWEKSSKLSLVSPARGLSRLAIMGEEDSCREETVQSQGSQCHWLRLASHR